MHQIHIIKNLQPPPPFNLEAFSYNIKKLRIVNNFTQHELAEKINVSYNTVIAWEKGKSTPSLNHFILLKELYNTTYTDLYYGVYIVKQKKSNNTKKKIMSILFPTLGSVLSIGLVLGIIYSNNINSPNRTSQTPINVPKGQTDDTTSKKYTAKFLDYDKETLIWDHEFKEDDYVFYGAKVPANKEDDYYHYIFVGWDYNQDGLIDNINIKMEKDTTFVAVFNCVKKSTITIEKYEIRHINDEVSINSYKGDEKNIIIPTYVNGLHITKINGSVFANNKNIETLVIPDGIEEIDGDCFEGCINLKKVIFPSNMNYIGPDAFKDCWSLKDITLPNTINDISDHAFENCTSLTSFTFPNNLKTISNGVLKGCKNIKEIFFNNEITKIDNSAFHTTGIESIQLPSSLTNLGSFVFCNCDNLKKVKINENESSDLMIGSDLYSITMKNIDTIIPKSTKYWKLSKTFVNFSTLDSWHFFYCGSEDDFKNINFTGDYSYGSVENKHIYFYSEVEQPQYWHYIDGVPTLY